MVVKFTFGICTNANDPDAASRVIYVTQSIRNDVPEDCREIILIGGRHEWALDARFVNFNESERNAWITRKKNIITNMASYENIVYMHDYFMLVPGWYAGWKQFGDNFNAAMNCIVNSNGERYRDWTLWVYPEVQDAIRNSGLQPHEAGLPYEITDLSKYQYFSGGYWVAKKKLMQQVPLDEGRCWGEGEDVDWSTRFTRHAGFTFSMNPNSTVMINKPHKGPILSPMPQEKGQEIRRRLLGC